MVSKSPEFRRQAGQNRHHGHRASGQVIGQSGRAGRSYQGVCALIFSWCLQMRKALLVLAWAMLALYTGSPILSQIFGTSLPITGKQRIQFWTDAMKAWLTAEAKAHFPATPLLDFALAVEQITTRKKVPGNAGLFFCECRLLVSSWTSL